MDRQNAIFIVRKYVKKEQTRVARKRWNPFDEASFEQTSCARYFANVLLSEIIISKSDPIQTIENFIKKMDDYSCSDKPYSWIFSVGSDTAKDILDTLILNMERNSHV